MVKDERIAITGASPEVLTNKNELIKVLEEKTGPFVESMMRQYERQISQFSVVCYSMTNERPQMWSHYADEHTGICLKFENDDDDFDKSCFKVEYGLTSLTFSP